MKFQASFSVSVQSVKSVVLPFLCDLCDLGVRSSARTLFVLFEIFVVSQLAWAGLDHALEEFA